MKISVVSIIDHRPSPHHSYRDSEELQPELIFCAETENANYLSAGIVWSGACAVWKCLCFFTITIISVYNEQIYNLPSTGQITG